MRCLFLHHINNGSTGARGRELFKGLAKTCEINASWAFSLTDKSIIPQPVSTCHISWPNYGVAAETMRVAMNSATVRHHSWLGTWQIVIVRNCYFVSPGTRILFCNLCPVDWIFAEFICAIPACASLACPRSTRLSFNWLNELATRYFFARTRVPGNLKPSCFNCLRRWRSTSGRLTCVPPSRNQQFVIRLPEDVRQHRLVVHEWVR